MLGGGYFLWTWPREPAQQGGNMKLIWMRGLAGVAIAAATVLTTAGPSVAGPRTPGDPFEVVRTTSNPFAVYEGTTRRGDAAISYRLAKLATGLRSQSAWKLKDTSQDGRLVHGRMTTMVNSGWCYAPKYTSCNQEYYPYGGVTKTQGWGGSYRSNWMFIHQGVSTTGTFARLSARMCITKVWRPDFCGSGYAISSGWQY
jgi:hypothetical protein